MGSLSLRYETGVDVDSDRGVHSDAALGHQTGKERKRGPRARSVQICLKTARLIERYAEKKIHY